jgi:FAD-linked sulfhydryl oxidase
MLDQFPIKDGSRKEVVFYICFLHNKVNERLHKPIFDCQKAFDFWGGDCGCSGEKNEDEKNEK